MNPDRYTDFINDVKALLQGMDPRYKSNVIVALGEVNPDRYSFLQNFIRQNPLYFTYVSADQFSRRIISNMTQQQLQEHLERLHREYLNKAPAGTPQALAFEVHTFANQGGVGETGEKQSFNDAVLEHIASSIEGDVLDYNIVLGLLSSELATLKNDPLKSDAIKEDVYNWVIEINKDPQDQNAIATVVTYLKQKDNTHGKLRTWLYAFMDESKNAYDGRNSESCIMGIKERVITSLRSAIPGDAALAPSVVRLTKDDVINQLSQGMNGENKGYVIQAVGKVNPVRYTESFIETVNILSQWMDARNKSHVIEVLGKVNPDHYADFINTVAELPHGMDLSDKKSVIETAGEVNPDRYTDFIKTVKALCQEMDVRSGWNVVMAVGKVNPDRYTYFIKTVNALSQGVDTSYKVPLICVFGRMNPDLYACFINTVNALSQGMDPNDKVYVIDALGEVNPDYYTELFINTVDTLSQGVDPRHKWFFIQAVGKVNPDLYTERFINTVNVLSQRMGASDKSHVIEALGQVNPDHYPFLQNFIRQNPRYFSYVPADQFSRSITSNMTQQERQDMTQQELQAHLERLHREYYNQAPVGTPQGLAFGIHNFANQEVVGKTGEKQRFNQAVLNHIESSIEGGALDYNIVLGLLNSELATLQSDPLKSDEINEEVYNWVIQANKDMQDKNAIALVVTYLEQKDKTHGKLATWLYVFMDESKNAYDGRNSKSCIMGVKERVITSLRSAIPEGDAALENLFHQAEAPLMLAAKSKKVTDHAFWAKKLKQKGVTSATHKDIAKDKFKEALVEFFAADESAQEIIDEALYAFDDSYSDSDDASLRLAAPGDGLWSKIKAAL